MTQPFPQSMDYVGHNEPMRIECDIYDLVVEGELPSEINGIWYRSIPDPQYPPLHGDDVFISGDGMVNAIVFENGHADYKLRYVQTERLQLERTARRALFGRYRNPFTDDPSVQGRNRGVANTTPIYHGGRLLALKEDSRAIELDPHTLETRGVFDFGGKLRSPTMTAHTRLDPDTGELFFFGYEAGGLASTDVAYCIADKDGNLVHEEWFKAPYCAMMHDFVVTKEHALFPVMPTTTSLELLQAGAPHWAWDPAKPSYVGIMPRHGSVTELRWFEGPPCFSYHMMNAFTEGSKVHMDLCVADMNMFPFIMAAGGHPYNPMQANARLARWTFDLAAFDAGTTRTWTETLLGPGGDMPRIADKDMLRDYRIGYMAAFDPRLGPPILSGPTPAGFNALLRVDLKTGELRTWSEPETTLQEPVHIASQQDGHEGYLALVCDLHTRNTADILVFEAASIERGPIARLKLPLRQRSGVHGNWVAASALR
jgi:carotenoid cleavage dioxygenase-like enzyme